MIEFDVQALLWRHHTKTSKYMFSNIFTFYGTLNVELDFLLIEENGMCTEYEIKCNRKDFTDEFLTKIDKHTLLSKRDLSCPNKYVFISPEGVIKSSDIPEYAGFVELVKQEDGTYKYRVVKKPPILHKHIIDPKDLFQKLYYRYFNYENIRFNNDRKRIRKSNGEKALAAPRVSKKKVTRRRRRR